MICARDAYKTAHNRQDLLLQCSSSDFTFHSFNGTFILGWQRQISNTVQQGLADHWGSSYTDNVVKGMVIIMGSWNVFLQTPTLCQLLSYHVSHQWKDLFWNTFHKQIQLKLINNFSDTMNERIYLLFSWTTNCNQGLFCCGFWLLGWGFLEGFWYFGCLLGSSSWKVARVFTFIFNWDRFSRADYHQPHLPQSMVGQPHSFLFLPC